MGMDPTPPKDAKRSVSRRANEYGPGWYRGAEVWAPGSLSTDQQQMAELYQGQSVSFLTAHGEDVRRTTGIRMKIAPPFTAMIHLIQAGS